MAVSAHSFTDYRNEVLDDACRVIDDNGRWYIENGYDFNAFYDDIWTDDSVTGNGSDSYYFNAHKAKQAISDIIWDDEFRDMCQEWDMDGANMLANGPEAIDVALRCYALGFVRDELEDYWGKRFGEEE